MLIFHSIQVLPEMVGGSMTQVLLLFSILCNYFHQILVTVLLLLFSGVQLSQPLATLHLVNLPVISRFIMSQNQIKNTQQALTVDEVLKRYRPIIIAHRGYSAKAPENTFSAFQAAIDAGAKIIELDVTLTKDSQLIVIHDDTVDRTTNGKGNVSDFTLDELQNLDAGEWFSPEFKGEKLPLLAEVLDVFGNKVIINIEIKSQLDPDTPIARKVVDVIKNKACTSSVIISSFDHNLLKQVNELDESIKIGVLSDEDNLDNVDIVEQTKSLNGISFNPCSKSIRAIDVKKLHEAGILVLPWSYTKDDSPKHVEMLLDLGVDGVFTNFSNLAPKNEK